MMLLYHKTRDANGNTWQYGMMKCQHMMHLAIVCLYGLYTLNTSLSVSTLFVTLGLCPQVPNSVDTSKSVFNLYNYKEAFMLLMYLLTTDDVIALQNVVQSK